MNNHASLLAESNAEASANLPGPLLWGLVTQALPQKVLPLTSLEWSPVVAEGGQRWACSRWGGPCLPLFGFECQTHMFSTLYTSSWSVADPLETDLRRWRPHLHFAQALLCQLFALLLHALGALAREGFHFAQTWRGSREDLVAEDNQSMGRDLYTE